MHELRSIYSFKQAPKYSGVMVRVTDQWSGGSKRGARDAYPLPGPNSFIFMQFLAKIFKNDKLAHPFQELAPSLRNPVFNPWPSLSMFCAYEKTRLGNLVKNTI